MGSATSPSIPAQPAGRVEEIIETGLLYRPGDPVAIRVVRRPHRTLVSDDGAAVKRTGRPLGWREAGERLARDRDVNLGRNGAVSLPVVAVGPSEAVVVARIAEASLALYQTLLDLER